MTTEETSPLFLAVGRLGRPHGVQGEITFSVITDFPERIKSGQTVFLGDERIPLRIRRRREIAGGLLLSFKGYNTPEHVRELTGTVVYVRGEELPDLPEGEYYHHQLLGLEVVDEDGIPLGKLAHIIENPANDIYVVQPLKGAEILLPAIEDVILDIDLQKGQVRVHLLDGLLPD